MPTAQSSTLKASLDNPDSLIPLQLGDYEEVFIVFRHYKFYKQLTVELYGASTTQDGRLKNPLTLISPFDLMLTTSDPDELKFFSAICRFQNNPTATKTAADIDALKLVMKNHLQLRFFYHDPAFSENVAAGSLREVIPGRNIDDLRLSVDKKKDYYQVTAHLIIDDSVVSLDEVEIRYDYFIVENQTIHLLAKFHLLKLVRHFKYQKEEAVIDNLKFKQFQKEILEKLADMVTVRYNFIEEADEVQLESHGFKQTEKLIYLSDLTQYVMINPVLRYGSIEIPILTKRQIYAEDEQGELFAVKRNDEEEIKFAALLVKQHREFEEQLQSDFNYFYLHKKHFLDEEWFLRVFDQWQNEGITILGFNQLKGNKINGNKAKVTIHVTSGVNWFNTDINVRFGKKKASLKQLHQSVLNKTKFVKLDDGTLGILPQDWLKKFEQFFAASDLEGELLRTPKMNFATVKDLYNDDELEQSVRDEIAAFEAKLKDVNKFPDFELPQDLKGSLRVYQQQGVQWLNLMDEYNFGGCLADDMGLGKTIQVIAFILMQRSKVVQNTNLVVVPTSLIFNWQVEIEKFAPSIKLFTLYGAKRLRSSKELDNYEIVLTTYGTLLSDITFLRNYIFNYIFLDESQNIKNVESQRYHSVRQLQSRNKIAITGTPIENNTLDLFAQLSFACPGLLGSKQSFKALYSIPIDKFKSNKHVTRLQEKVAPFILRRTKKEVAKELPEKTEMTLYCPMGEAQRKIYTAYEKEFRDFISSATEEELTKEKVHILKGLTRLRQICDSPLLLEDEKLYGDSSSKIEALVEQVENKSARHKILIFSQFVSMLELLKNEFDQRNIAYEFLSGGTKDREKVVNNFQENENIRVFLISLKAGGTGLNLTQADYVYLVDPWWNPAVENQAIDRAYRIGQEKHVMAVRLICPGTLEEKMMKLSESKRSLSDNLVKTGNAFVASLSKKEWLDLLTHADEATLR